MKAQTTFSLRDQLFNQQTLTYLADHLTQAYPNFPRQQFIDQSLQTFPNLKLKECITHMTQLLHQYLPPSYPQALEIILKSLPPELDPSQTDDDFGDFILAPLSQYVATYGCIKEHLDISLIALKEITKRFSAEDAIRHFLNAFPQSTLNFLIQCAHDPNYHVRRLASEGTRPKLPWCIKLEIDYHQPLPILDILYTDTTTYVARSVANHLNDLSKIEPQLVIQTLTHWQTTPGPHQAYITKHALRTLTKQGNASALKLLGYTTNPKVNDTSLNIVTPKVKIGSSLTFQCTLTSQSNQKLLLDYTIQYPSPGKTPTNKVFQLKQLSLKKTQNINITKSHPFRLMTTRRLYPGTHTITLRANGKPIDQQQFQLTT